MSSDWACSPWSSRSSSFAFAPRASPPDRHEARAHRGRKLSGETADAIRAARHPRRRRCARGNHVPAEIGRSACAAGPAFGTGVRANRALSRRSRILLRSADRVSRHAVSAPCVEKNRRHRPWAHAQLRRDRARAGLLAARRGSGLRRQPGSARGAVSSRARRRRPRRIRSPRRRVPPLGEALVARARGRRPLKAMNTDNAALLDEFCDAVWLEDGLAKNTLESYRRDLRLFADWHERQGHATLLAATEADLSGYFAWRYSRGTKQRIRSSTQARLHSSLKRFYR